MSKEKTGVFTGAYALNPVTKLPIPVWIADYVLVGYGTGAIMPSRLTINVTGNSPRSSNSTSRMWSQIPTT